MKLEPLKPLTGSDFTEKTGLSAQSIFLTEFSVSRDGCSNTPEVNGHQLRMKAGWGGEVGVSGVDRCRSGQDDG
jgi:hypothetical protein